MIGQVRITHAAARRAGRGIALASAAFAAFVASALFGAAVAFAPSAAAGEGGGEVSMNEYGGLRLGGDFNLSVFHAGPNWSSNVRMNRASFVADAAPAAAKPAAPGEKRVAGAFRVNERETFVVEASLADAGERRWRYHLRFRAEAPVDGLLFLSMDVPVERGFAPTIDGTPRPMPAEYGELAIYDTPKGAFNREIAFQSDDGRITLSGEFTCRLQDNRRFKQATHNLRVPVAAGPVGEAEIVLDIRLDRLESRAIDLRAAANMAFADETPGDGRGGWTDQGPQNDLACLPTGPRNFGGLDFDILDPNRNNGKGCVVLSGVETRRFPPHGAVAVEPPAAHAYLYLLHGAAWTPAFGEEIGRVRVSYAGAEDSLHPVKNGIDVGNWWRPSMSYPNGLLVWKGDNRGGEVGLFAAAFRLRDAPVTRIAFESAGGVWMIAAAAFANMTLERPAEKALVIEAGQDWSPLAFDARVEKDSPLDFSFLLDAPAGKHGWVKATPEGHLAFENAPERPVRFWGTNLCQSALFPEHAETDALVETLARSGYNSLRLHQFERGLWDRKADDTLSFEPGQLDRFFYLIAKLKEKGLYLTLDIFATRPIRPGDRIAECERSDGMERKTLNFFSPSAMDNWIEYARRLLTTKNPYTGLSLAEDPALYAVNLDNEAPLFHTWNQFPAVARVPGERYAEYLRANGRYSPERAAERGVEFRAFLAQRQRETQRAQIRVLRELGCRFLITNLNNFTAAPELQPHREELDLVDIHCYHDHPVYPQARWSLPAAHRQNSDIADHTRSLNHNWAARIFGKPLLVTELDFCNPNQYRAAGGALAGAYAALQDWSGVYRFSYTHDKRNFGQVQIMRGFDTVYDPVRSFADRQSALLFLRGDVKPAEAKLAFTWTAEMAFGEPLASTDKFPEEFTRLGLVGQVGSTPADRPAKVARTRPEDWRADLPTPFAEALARPKSAPVKSATGEIELDAAGDRLRVVTPRSEAFCLPEGAMKGEAFAVEGVDAYSSISLHALDGRPLAESRSLLLLHLTNAANSGQRFRDDTMKLLENWGELPFLIRRGRATAALTFKTPASANAGAPTATVSALHPDGRIKGSFTAEARDGVLRLPLDTAEALAWHIRR